MTTMPPSVSPPPSRQRRWTIAAILAAAVGFDALVTAWTLVDADRVATNVTKGTARPAAAIVFYGGRGEQTHRRVEAGVHLLARGEAERLVLLGGCRAPPRESGALHMRDLVRSLGIPPHKVVADRCSFDTHTNLLGLVELQRVYGWRRVVLVSDALHLRRILPGVRERLGDAGVEVDMRPSGYAGAGDAIWRAHYELVVSALPPMWRTALAHRLRSQTESASRG